MEEKWKELLTFIAKNNHMDSPFLYAGPLGASVDVTSLLEKIAELRGISNKENGKEFNEICDNLEK